MRALGEGKHSSRQEEMLSQFGLSLAGPVPSESNGSIVAAWGCVSTSCADFRLGNTGLLQGVFHQSPGVSGFAYDASLGTSRGAKV